MNQFPHVRVEGSALDRGRAYGSQARDRVQRSVAAYRDVFADWAGWDWATVRREAARFEAPIAAFRPTYLDEIRGIAEGAGLDPGDVLAINVRTEVMFAAKARQAAAQRHAQDGCTSFAVVPPPGLGGSTLIGTVPSTEVRIARGKFTFNMPRSYDAVALAASISSPSSTRRWKGPYSISACW